MYLVSPFPARGAGGRGVRTLPPRLLLLGAGTLLQTAGATLAALTVASLPPGLLPLAALLFALGILCLVGAISRRAPWPAPLQVRYRLGALALLALLLLADAYTLGLGATALAKASSPDPYNSDASAFNAYNARLVLEGVNPYTADNRYWDALQTYPDVGATPIRRGIYAESDWGPAIPQIRRDVDARLANPARRGPEYPAASLHSYPALSFLVYVPLVWLGLPNTMALNALLLVCLLVAAAWGTPRGLRFGVWATLLAGSFLIFYALGGSFEVVAFLPVLLAWRWREHRWLSPLLLGLGCAVKQVVWPLALFYLVITWRERGPRAAVERGGVALLAFLLPNLPFLAASPSAWASSLLLPITLPVFPSGIGLIALARGGLLPLWPAAAYTALELAALVGLLLWFARARQLPRPESALVLGTLPLLLAWHSTAGYFAVLPALAVYAAMPLLVRDLHT